MPCVGGRVAVLLLSVVLVTLLVRASPAELRVLAPPLMWDVGVGVAQRFCTGTTPHLCRYRRGACACTRMRQCQHSTTPVP